MPPLVGANHVITADIVSGSGGKLTGSELFDVKCMPVVGTMADADNILHIDVSVLFPDVEEEVIPGVVPLYITRVGGDIKISWTVDEIPDIYGMEGDGTGTYVNDGVSWGLLDLADLPPVFEDHSASKYILFLGQIGEGAAEAYFKGLVAGTDPSAAHPDGGTYLSQAPAVGKLDLAVSRLGNTGWNFVAYPFAARNIANSLYGGFSNYDELRIWDEAQKKFTEVVKYNNGWASRLMARGEGFLLYRGVAGPVSATLIGEVDVSSQTVVINRVGQTGWNFIGLPFLGKRTMGELDPAAAHADDEIRIWDEDQKKFVQTLKKAQWTGLELEPRKSYLYYRAVPASYNWQMNW